MFLIKVVLSKSECFIKLFLLFYKLFLGLVLDDFDLKRSHSLSSVAEKANYAVDPRRSIRAWEGGKSADDVSKSNSYKISLDFK